MSRMRSPLGSDQAAQVDAIDTAGAMDGWRPARLSASDRRDWRLWVAGSPAHTSEPTGNSTPLGLAGLFGASGPHAAATGHHPPTPHIESDRLVLRRLELEDFPAYAEMLADQGTFRFSERGAMKGDEAWTRLLRQVGHWALMGWGLFAVEEKASGCLVGEVGLGDFRRELGAPFHGVPEAGWTIAPGSQGRGYATEAMRAALAWIEARLGAQRTVCLIHAENKRSLRVAEKLGYLPFATHTYRGYEAYMLERFRGA